MTATLLRADARALPLADASVDLIVTSPPYWALRSYTDGGEHYAGQIGSEPTPAEYVDSLIDCTCEWMRVLKPSGSLWVNLGDKYATRWSSRSEGGGLHNDRGRDSRGGRNTTGVPGKSLIGLPWRYAIRCIDDLSLILRAEVIWSKPNGLPESVTDRVRRSHETWFHFTSSPRYFSAVDAIREAHSAHTLKYYGPGTAAKVRPKNAAAVAEGHWAGEGLTSVGAVGKLPGSVWEIATQPLKVPADLGIDHFAAFPMDWPRRLILGWSPSGICTACGEGRRPTTERGESSWQRRRADGDPIRYGLMGTAAPLQRSLSDAADRAAGGFGVPAERRITGEACACPDTSAPTRPAVVVDPFGGTGTTALVADALGRLGVSGDMSADYLRLARWRTTDPGQRAAALEVDKPPVQHRGQLDLFEVSA